MRRLRCVLLALVSVAATVVVAPPASAQTSVTYEVVSDAIGSVNLEFFDGTRRQAMDDVPLPWRITVPVANPTSVGFDTAEIRADWRWAAAPNRFVTTRIYFGDAIRCENTLDVGNAACYGTTPFRNG
jgi:hypothetical protein